MIVPAARAARAIAISPSAWPTRWNASGATTIGSEISLAEHGRRRAAVRDVDEHPRAQEPAPEGRDVVAQGRLVAGTPGVVAERPGREQLAAATS